MKTTASDILIDVIHDWGVHDWGVDVVFGMPGDGINGIMEALRKRADKIRFIQVRHEESAAFMACAYAKYTGKLGVCVATSGPGGLHLLNGLYDAKLDGAPVLAITGLQYHDLVHTHTQQDVELDKVFMDVARVVDQALNTPGPVLVEAIVDPYEPPMPPKVSVRQAERFAESLVRGQPNRGRILATIAEDRVRELV